MSIVISMFAAPNSGKSVLAARIYSLLARKGYDVEFIQEWAKRGVYLGADHEEINSKSLRDLDAVEAALNRHDVIVYDSSPLSHLLYAYGSGYLTRVRVDDFYSGLIESGHQIIHVIPVQYNSSLPFRQGGRHQTKEECDRLKKGFDLITEYFSSLDYTKVDILWNDSKLLCTLEELFRASRNQGD